MSTTPCTPLEASESIRRLRDRSTTIPNEDLASLQRAIEALEALDKVLTPPADAVVAGSAEEDDSKQDEKRSAASRKKKEKRKR